MKWHFFKWGFWVRYPPEYKGFYVNFWCKHPLLFSERYGYTPFFKLGPVKIKILKELS